MAKCDNLDEAIANCENRQETSLSQYDIEKLIVTVRIDGIRMTRTTPIQVPVQVPVQVPMQVQSTYNLLLRMLPVWYWQSVKKK